MLETLNPSRSALRAFLRGEAAGGVLLMLAAALALAIANGPFAAAYFQVLHARIGPLSVTHWIDDGLMTLFFLLVGLEIRREFAEGELADRSARVLPAIAALAGMIFPALIYLAITARVPGLVRGWAIPAATDIAFAIGVMALLGRRVPASLRMLLTTIAIVDDMGAVAVIALVYTAGIDGWALLAAGGVMGGMMALRRFGVDRLWPYLLLGALLWLAVLLSGIHATIAGVLTAMLIPARRTADGAPPALQRLERTLHPWVTYAVVPLFGFANAGVALAGLRVEQILAPLPLGVAGGLFLGKQAGVFLALWTCSRIGIARRPAGASWTQTYGMCLLCGIGFTMSLFVGGLAFADPALVESVKIGVLGGSILSAMAGYAVLRIARPLALPRK